LTGDLGFEFEFDIYEAKVMNMVDSSLETLHTHFPDNARQKDIN
jgi:hypothetical protein